MRENNSRRPAFTTASGSITGKKNRAGAKGPLVSIAVLAVLALCLTLIAGCTGTSQQPAAVTTTNAAVTPAHTAAQPAGTQPVPSGTPGQMPANRTEVRGASGGEPPAMNATIIGEMADRLEAGGADVSAIRTALASGDTTTAATLLRELMDASRGSMPGPGGNVTGGAPPGGAPPGGSQPPRQG